MKKKIVCVVLAMMVMVSCACAELAATPVPSRTVASVVVAAPAEVTTPGSEAPAEEPVSVVIIASVLEPETEEEQVFVEIATAAVESNVVDYFDEETRVEIQEALPESTELESLEMDEFFHLDHEGYTEEHGDLTATFEFATPYEEEEVLVAMVGILPKTVETADENAEETDTDAENTEETASENAEEAETDSENAGEEQTQGSTRWFTQKAIVVDGRVQVCFTQDVLSLMHTHEAVLVILRSNQSAAV